MIRPARAEDIAAMARLGAEFHAMAQLPTTYDAPSLSAFLREALASDAFAIFVIEHDAEVVGAAGVCVAPVFFNLAAKAAAEVFWFVSEEHRGTLDSVRLWRALEAWARDQGAATMTMTALAANPGVGDVYRRRGYAEAETHYSKRMGV